MVDDDAQLMLSAGRGDRKAFETLFERYTPPLLRFLGRMVRDPGRAEELAQEVFVRIYRARERYQPRARFSTWLFGIAHNLAINELDRAHHRHELPTPADGTADGPDPAPDPGAQLEAQRTSEALEHALAELPERQRAALLLRSEQGLDYREIAEALGVSVSSVKSLIHRARATLLRKLEGVES